MLCFSALLLSLLTVVSARHGLYRRAPCTCPPADTAFYPLSRPGQSGSDLQCVYPPLSRCEYSTADGSLLKDSDAGLCPPSAPGATCPPVDQAEFPLGPGSGAHGTTLYCTYPSESEATSTEYFCVYGGTTGALIADGNDSFCPPTAQCDASVPSGSASVSGGTTARSASSTGSTSINPAAASGHPTSRSTVRVLSTPSPSSAGQSTGTTTGADARASQTSGARVGLESPQKMTAVALGITALLSALSFV